MELTFGKPLTKEEVKAAQKTETAAVSQPVTRPGRCATCNSGGPFKLKLSSSAPSLRICECGEALNIDTMQIERKGELRGGSQSRL